MGSDNLPASPPKQDGQPVGSLPETIRLERAAASKTDTDGRVVTSGLSPAGEPANPAGTFYVPDRAGQQPESVPPRIGRFRVSHRLGGGGFGTVYLGHDEQMDRPVAIKVPRADRMDSSQAVAAFLAEARHVARLKHPGIVTIYDFGEAEGRCYLVYEFVEGQSLADRMRIGPIGYSESAQIVAEVADALHYAHGQGVFHRDIKPSNLLLDKQGHAHVTDFGLAVHEEELLVERGRQSGTDPYMSPEQVRGEGHRIDGRTDIYGLGVMLYELLCGRRPFEGQSRDAVFDQILHRDARPPRQINGTIPRELEQICLKAMSRRISERYGTAADLAEELRGVAATLPASAVAEVKYAPVPAVAESSRPIHLSDVHSNITVLPKGLRSYGPEDGEFFLELLPGPRGRDGLPESIRFWKSRIESRDPEGTFAVGLLYGPSGCGKSSLVRAGLLLRLGESVLPVYLEVTRTETESRLARALRNACPMLEPGERLRDLFVALRRGQALGGRKVLIVLDQFEQWLHEHGHDMETTELVAALRQADGRHVAVLVLVRDDFWMGITRLFECLEIHLDPARNTQAADLFDVRHAQRVLLLIGQAFDRLPPRAADLTDAQRQFLDRAVHELSEEGHVISVRLSLFAELMKERPWTMESLVEVGGTEGIGVRFLEETFTTRTAVPQRRALERPARAVLQALLPEAGTTIKGHLRGRRELAAAAGLADSSPRFNRLIEILDRDLHLITPTEAGQESGIGSQESGVGSQESNRPSSGLTPDSGPLTPAFYQLTHDYLVRPLRQWLTLEHRKSWRGRAELCLEERTGQMGRWPQSRYLPSLSEYWSITLAVPRGRRKPEQRALMREATRYFGIRLGAILGIALLLAVAIQRFAASVRETADQRRTETLIESLVRVAPEGVPYALEKLDPLQDRAIPLLRAKLRAASEDRERLRAACALARFGEVDREFLIEAVARASGGECSNIARALQPARDSLAELLFERATDGEAALASRVRYATVLLHLGEPRAAGRVLQLDANPTLRTTFIHGFKLWHGDLAILPDILRKTEDAVFRSGLCAALGLIEHETLDDDVRQSLAGVFKELYRTAPDTGTHSAAGWALQQWGGELPQIEPSDRPIDRREWFVNSHRMTMLRMSPDKFIMGDEDERSQGARPLHEVALTRGFFVCDREVTLERFKEFLMDDQFRAEADLAGWEPDEVVIDGDPQLPAQRVSWFDAVVFCNWLSWRERRQPCYVPTGEPQKSVDDQGNEHEWPVWRWVREANGYRLPTEAEWEYCCRARSRSAFSFGDDERLLPLYEVCGSSAPAPVGRRLPNGWGLFDTHGNVAEWCYDAYEPYAEGPVTDPVADGPTPFRVFRGGSWADLGVLYFHCGRRFPLPPTARNSNRGFRVVCGEATNPQDPRERRR